MTLLRLCLCCFLMGMAAFAAKAEDKAAGGYSLVPLALVTQEVTLPPVLSNLEERPDDLAIQGAHLALKDNKTTGRFLKQDFSLTERTLAEDADPLPTVQALVAEGIRIILLDLPPESLKRVMAGVTEQRVLFFNTRVQDNVWRVQHCDSRLLHTMPSRAMLTDALSQFLVKKRWKDWFLVVGVRPEDQLFAASLKRSAQKFGAKIVEEKVWNGGRDARRTAQAEVPLLTQGEDYDVLMVADELGDFGEYLQYRTYDPRPVAGTQGLFPAAWYWTIEQWGAAQLQNRFKRKTQRTMQDRDFAAWAAVRSVGEAATRTRATDFDTLNAYIQGPDFQLAAYKGRKLSYRPWNGQLRQAIAVTSARSLVAAPPLEGFMHRTNELDTLGFDQPEVSCGRK